ncbi:ABC transporter ATP-binding protein [Spongiibacter taiwanensis]|uniref:ABC transporter ATP-binding protein n=1 Tax=Spongiibacter taiwanensis TaxID=1748242 RepID=UPI0020364523|nr:ABC transporter ATP-binding protein [Spongiibacter taiwanensis]USA43147.1 ABC transporter ATP-binding protein [Spongiibacter taiwanensis]
MIAVENLVKTVVSGQQPLEILKGLNTEIKAGQSIAIIGPSGAGKSTLLGLLAGLDTPTAGRVMIDGHSLSDMNEDERADLRSRYVGFVFQSFQLLPGLTALENVMLPLELKGQTNATEVATRYLAEVGLSERQAHYPRHLSGGEQQRVALARAFAVQPQILFADEPTGNLDAATGEHIVELMFRMNQQSSTTLVLVTHELALARRCDRVLELRNGQLTEGPA